jgi:hypothetical protein
VWHALLRDTRFFELLYALDRDLADLLDLFLEVDSTY